MSDDLNIISFKDYNIRRKYDKKSNNWFFSVIDIAGALTDSTNPAAYWRKLKQRLKKEGSEVVTFCHGFKLKAPDGKMRITDCANTESLFRIIQSIPSPNAEPFKQWLAKVGYERVQEINDPERSINRARENWQKHGRSAQWIQQRMMGQETRNKLTDYWKNHDIKEGKEYAILTNIIHEEWAQINIKEHKDLKGLQHQNLRDHMSNAELIFTALAELSTRKVAENVDATGMKENKKAAKIGGNIAKNARIELEKTTGQKVVTGKNHLKLTNE
tara:strand:+ start:2240 stop:3058 length:819 start_codon:yes stop_codon:yes gene_type:complete